jgi:hypothetical protein
MAWKHQVILNFAIIHNLLDFCYILLVWTSSVFFYGKLLYIG